MSTSSIRTNSAIIRSARLVADTYRSYMDEHDEEPEEVFVKWADQTCRYYNRACGETIDYVLAHVNDKAPRVSVVEVACLEYDSDYVCEDCGEVVSGCDVVAYDGHYYCFDCATETEDLTTCDECGEWVPADELVEVHRYSFGSYYEPYETVYMCESCADGTAHQCADCGEWFTGLGDGDGEVRVQTANGGHEWRALCGECVEDHYSVCTDCQEYVRDEDVVYIDDDPYCPACAADHDTKGLQGYGHTRKTMELRTGNEPEALRSLLLGVELETESDDNEATATAVRDAAESVTGNRGAVSCKKDGSLRGYGCEIVTQPFTPAYHLNTDFWRDVRDAARRNGATSHDGGRCGLHIHVSRDYLDTRRRVDAFVCLFGTFIREWVNFSRRSMEKAIEWANPRLDARDAYHQCPRWVDYMAAFNVDRNERYQFVNLQNYATVELRLMRGTLNLETLRATIEAVTAIAIIAHDYEDAAHIFDWRQLCELMLSELSGNGLPYEELRNYLIRRELMPTGWGYTPRTREQHEADIAYIAALERGETPSDEVKRLVYSD